MRSTRVGGSRREPPFRARLGSAVRVVSKRFVRKGDRLRLTLAEEERDLLAHLPDELRTLYRSDPDDPAVQRMFPRAYLDPTEDAAEEVWRALQQPELLRQRIEAIDALTEVLANGVVDRKGRVIVDLADDEVPALLRVLNDARLTLGTRLDVTDDTDLAEVAPDDPRAPAFMAYGWLTYLEGELVEVLLGDLPG